MPALLRSRLAEEFARNREESARNRRFFDRLHKEAGEREQLMREFIRRSERVMGDLVEMTNDLRDESRAHTQAVLRMMDMLDERLPPRDEPA